MSGPDDMKEKEVLPHDPNRVITGFTESPAGTKCIGMTFGGKEWLLVKAWQTPLVTRMVEQLRRTEKYNNVSADLVLFRV